MIINRLQDFMDKENLNISQLSEITDISRNTLSSFINKGTDLTAFKTKTLEKLCSHFGITIGDLLIYIDDSISVKSIWSLGTEGDFEETNDRKRFYEQKIDLKLKNEFKKTFSLRMNVNCSTGLLTNFLYDENFTYNLYEIEIDQRIPKYQKDSISEDNIRNLLIETNFLVKKVFFYIPDLLDNDFLDISKTPLNKIKFKYLSYKIDGGTFEKSYNILISDEKEIKFLPDL